MKTLSLKDHLYDAFMRASHIMLEKWLADDLELDRATAKISLQGHFPIIQGWSKDIPWTERISIATRHKIFQRQELGQTYLLFSNALSMMDDGNANLRGEGATFILNMLSTAYEEHSTFKPRL